MRAGVFQSFILLLVTLSLTGCGGKDFQDLRAYMDKVRDKPKGHIEPIPAFQPYKAFTYGAAAMRGPFDKPVAVKEITRLSQKSDIKPDPDRAREQLEDYNFESLAMVGTLQQQGQLWVLISDGEGGVHRVTEGNYLGRNNGRIVEATQSHVSVVEIIPNGVGGWMERPRTLQLKESD